MNKQKVTLLKGALLVLLALALNLASFSQAPTYTCVIKNDMQVDANTFQFDIYLINSGVTPSDPFKLSTHQYGIFFNQAIRNGGTITGALTNSELGASQQNAGINIATHAASGNKYIQITSPAAVPPGTIIPTAPGLRVATVTLTNTQPWGTAAPNLQWMWTATSTPCVSAATSPAYYGSKVSYFNTSAQSKALCVNTASHIYDVANAVLNPPAPTAFAMTAGGSYCQGSGGYAVGLLDSELGVNYTLWKDGSATATVVPGTGDAITFGMQLFGTYTAKGTGPGGTTDMTGSAVVTETPLVTPAFTQLGPYCVGATPGLLPTTSNNGVMGTWFPATINTATAGVFNFDFTPTTGCANPTSMSITVNENVIPTFTQLGPYCVGATPDVLPTTSLNGITGTWNAAINTAAAGVITYTFTPDGGQCAAGTTMDVTVTSCGPIDYTWNGANTMWTMPTNWTPNGVPGALDNVNIPAGFGMNYPEITEATTIASLTIATGGALKGNANLTVTGATTVNVDLAGATNFHYISSPTANPTAISALDPATFLRKFDEAAGNWVNLNGTDVLAPGKGYAAYGVAQTANFTGTLNAGFVTPAMTNTGNIGGANYEGWNLIGNPYCSPVDLSSPSLVYSDVMPTAYFWNGASNQYAYHNWQTHVNLNATQYVPVGQAFFVKASGVAPVVSFSEMCRTFNTQNFFKNSVDNVIRLHLEGEQMTNDAVVMFDENATTAIDNNYDAFALKASEINFIYTKSIENYDLAINALTSPEVNAVVPVYMDVVKSGNYTITASDLETFTYSLPIWLTDLKTGYSQNLLVNPVYSFSAQANENAGRFKLSFGSVGINDPAASNIGIYAERKNVHVTTPDNFRGTVQVYDILGKLVAERQLSGAGENIISLNVAGATYLVKVTNAQSSITRKVVLN